MSNEKQDRFGRPIFDGETLGNILDRVDDEEKRANLIAKQRQLQADLKNKRKRWCPISSHASDCDCRGAGGDR